MKNLMVSARLIHLCIPMFYQSAEFSDFETKILRMSSHDNAHNFKVENNKTPGLPKQISAPEACCFGWYWWIRFIVISANYIFYHFIRFT
jgi:hypothetical protein